MIQVHIQLAWFLQLFPCQYSQLWQNGREVMTVPLILKEHVRCNNVIIAKMSYTERCRHSLEMKVYRAVVGRWEGLGEWERRQHSWHTTLTSFVLSFKELHPECYDSKCPCCSQTMVLVIRHRRCHQRAILPFSNSACLLYCTINKATILNRVYPVFYFPSRRFLTQLVTCGSYF